MDKSQRGGCLRPRITWLINFGALVGPSNVGQRCEPMRTTERCFRSSALVFMADRVVDADPVRDHPDLRGSG
jgi:hypothetical protein